MKKWKVSEKWTGIMKTAGKYKYAVLVLLIGAALLLAPSQSNGKRAETAVVAAEEPELAEQLENLLSQLQGAGRTKVLLTSAGGTEYEYQTDTNRESDSDGSAVQTETVLAAAGSGKEEPLIVRTTYAGYVGAVILCEGADRASVRLDIINAVSSATGLSSDQITVIKMKSK